MTHRFPDPERRGQTRRVSDRVVDDLQKSLRSCLEHMADGVLLLDSEMRVFYATPSLAVTLKRHHATFAISPKFILHQPPLASRFDKFINEKNHTTGPLTLLFAGDNGPDRLLLNCFILPPSDNLALQTVRYLITLRNPNRDSTQQWLLFNKQFNLTQAEARLCRALADGLTLRDYCQLWKVAISTARSQLSSVFNKTSIRRQSDLLRLIFLFTRS